MTGKGVVADRSVLKCSECESMVSICMGRCATESLNCTDSTFQVLCTKHQSVFASQGSIVLLHLDDAVDIVCFDKLVDTNRKTCALQERHEALVFLRSNHLKHLNWLLSLCRRGFSICTFQEIHAFGAIQSRFLDHLVAADLSEL